MERLTIKKPSGIIKAIDDDPMGWATCIYRLSDYEDLEEQGLLHIAPLKDGTPIYAIVEDCIDFGEKERYIVRSSYLHGVTEYEFGELNKDFFTSEQAAENYLSLRSSGVIADLEKLCEKTMKTNV